MITGMTISLWDVQLSRDTTLLSMITGMTIYSFTIHNLNLQEANTFAARTCCVYFVYIVLCVIIVCVSVYLVVFVVFFLFCNISFSTLILLVGSFDL